MFFRNSRFPSNQILNSLWIDRIFKKTPHNLWGARREHEKCQGKRHIKEIAPYVSGRISRGREVAGMNQLFLLIYYPTSLRSKWNNKEKQLNPEFCIKFSTLIYFQNQSIMFRIQRHYLGRKSRKQWQFGWMQQVLLGDCLVSSASLIF